MQFITQRWQNIQKVFALLFEKAQKSEVLIPFSVAAYVGLGIFLMTSWSLAVAGYVVLGVTIAATLAVPAVKYAIDFALKALNTLDKSNQTIDTFNARIERFATLQKLLEDTLKGENPALVQLKEQMVKLIEEEMKKLTPQVDLRIGKLSAQLEKTVGEQVDKLNAQLNKTVQEQVDKAIATEAVTNLGTLAKKLNGQQPLTGQEARSVRVASWFTRGNTQPATPTVQAVTTPVAHETAPAQSTQTPTPSQEANTSKEKPAEKTLDAPKVITTRQMRKRKDPAPITPQRELNKRRRKEALQPQAKTQTQDQNVSPKAIEEAVETPKPKSSGFWSYLGY